MPAISITPLCRGVYLIYTTIKSLSCPQQVWASYLIHTTPHRGVSTNKLKKQICMIYVKSQTVRPMLAFLKVLYQINYSTAIIGPIDGNGMTSHHILKNQAKVFFPSEQEVCLSFLLTTIEICNKIYCSKYIF